jgi:hypothetical protein
VGNQGHRATVRSLLCLNSAVVIRRSAAIKGHSFVCLQHGARISQAGLGMRHDQRPVCGCIQIIPAFYGSVSPSAIFLNSGR